MHLYDARYFNAERTSQQHNQTSFWLTHLRNDALKAAALGACVAIVSALLTMLLTGTIAAIIFAFLLLMFWMLLGALHGALFGALFKHAGRGLFWGALNGLILPLLFFYWLDPADFQGQHSMTLGAYLYFIGLPCMAAGASSGWLGVRMTQH